MIQKVSLIKDPEEINAIYNFIRRQNLDYPQYDEWCKKCYDELQTEYKKSIAIIIKDENDVPKVVGAIIFQKHKKDPLMLELKNIRVKEEYRKKKVFTKLLSKVEEYAAENNYKRLIVDFNIDRDDAIFSALQSKGYKVEAKENLYTAQRIDIIMTKDINAQNKIISGLESKIITIENKLYLIFNTFFKNTIRLFNVKNRQ